MRNRSICKNVRILRISGWTVESNNALSNPRPFGQNLSVRNTSFTEKYTCSKERDEKDFFTFGSVHRNSVHHFVYFRPINWGNGSDQLKEWTRLAFIYVLDPIHTSCGCRAEPNPIYCIQVKNNRMYVVRHGSGSATAQRKDWPLVDSASSLPFFLT